MSAATADLFPISPAERERFLAEQRDKKKNWKEKAQGPHSGLSLLLDGDYEDWLSQAAEERVDQINLFNDDQLEPAIPRWTDEEVLALHEFILSRLGQHLRAHYTSDSHKRLVWMWFLTCFNPEWKKTGYVPFSFHACCLCSGIDAEDLQLRMIHDGKEQFIRLFGEDKYRATEAVMYGEIPPRPTATRH